MLNEYLLHLRMYLNGKISNIFSYTYFIFISFLSFQTYAPMSVIYLKYYYLSRIDEFDINYPAYTVLPNLVITDQNSVPVDEKITNLNGFSKSTTNEFSLIIGIIPY